jgi:non-specific serine/threonine protein kinase
LEAVEALCAALDGEAGHVLEAVASLLEKNLLHQREQEGNEPRLLLLETIREFGLECLATSGEIEATGHAHAMYYLQLAQEAAQHWFGAQEQAWLNRLEREHDNLRTAMTWLLEGRQARESREMALRLGAALWWFWLVSSYYNEGWSLLERRWRAAREWPCRYVLRPSGRAGTWLATWALIFLMRLAIAQGEYSRIGPLAEESLTLFREAGHQKGMADTLKEVAKAMFFQGDRARAHALAQECLALERQIGDQGGEAEMLAELGEILLHQGDPPTAHLGSRCPGRLPSSASAL